MFIPRKDHLKHICHSLLVIALVSCGRGKDATAPTPAVKVPARIVVSVPGGNTTLNPNTGLQLAAVTYAADNSVLTEYALKFSSTSPTIASVTNGGFVATSSAPGTTEITASYGSVVSNAITITVPNLAGIPTKVTKVKSPPTTLVVATSDTVRVKVSDYFNAPVAGITVSFAYNGFCGIAGTRTSITDSNGEAFALITVGTVAGISCLVVASVGSLPNVSFSSSAIGGPPAFISVTSYGVSPTVRYLGVSQGGADRVSIDVYDAYRNNLSDAPRNFLSRDPTIARWVSPTSSDIIGVAPGQTYLVASAGSAVDSILVGVGPSNGALVGVGLIRPDLKADTTFSAAVVLRSGISTRISSATFVVNWDPAVLTYISSSSNFGGSMVVNTADISSGKLTIAYATSGAADYLFLRNITFKAASTVGLTGAVTVTVQDISSEAFADLLPTTRTISYPVRIR